jgi:hypothetical protein
MPSVCSHKDLIWLDLCSGLGGASQPALDRGWTVIRIDVERRFGPDIVADIRSLPINPARLRPTVLWASPPCQEFSKHGLRCFYPNPERPDISIAQNVWASRPWLTRLFGPVRAMPPGHALWSNLAFLLPSVMPHKSGRRAFAHIGRNVPAYVSNPRPGHNRAFIPHLRHMPAEAAKIPYEIGEAICRTVEEME